MGVAEQFTSENSFSEGLRPDQQRIVELVRRWGGSTTDAILDPRINIFTQPGIDGFIGYRQGGHCFVVFGDPICPSLDRNALTHAFHDFANKQNKSIVYIAASKNFAHWALENVCGSLVEYGKELVFDPTNDPRERTGNYGSLVRRKTKQAANFGVQVHEYRNLDPELEHSIEQVAREWLQGRKGVQIHISDAHLFDNRFGKRWLYARMNDQLVGVIVLNQLESQKGWLINHLMITPEAPNGTSELLVVTALEALEKEGCRFATVGSVTAEELGEIRGFNKFSVWMSRKLFKLIKRVVNLDNRSVFWSKFDPQSLPAYVLFSRKNLGMKEIFGLKRALSGNANDQKSS